VVELERMIDATLSKTKIPGAKSFERGTVSRHDVCVDRRGSGDEPRVVLAQAPGCPALEQSAPLRLREVQSLNREPLQRRRGGRLVGRTFQQLLDAGNSVRLLLDTHALLWWLDAIVGCH
jgi:hypothetical protein